jgi:hypothetical protein
MKNFFGSLLFALSTLVSQAATLTTTTLTGADFPGWGPGTNEQRWFVSTTTGTAASVRDSTQNGRGSIGANSFFIRGADGGGYIDAFFKLGGGLNVGESVSFDFVYSWNGGTRGIEFISGTDKVSFTHSGSNALNFVNLAGTASAIDNAGYNSPFRITASATGANQLTIETTNLQNSAFKDTQIVTMAVSGLNEIKFYTGDLGAGIALADIDNFGLMINNFSVIPEPSTPLLMGLGLAGLAVLRLRRVRKNG